MPIKQKDFIEVEYTGKLKDSGDVFDTTDKKIAEDSGISNPSMEYGPIVICVGEGHMIKGLDKEIVGKDIGKHTIELDAENAFGKKDPKYIQLIPTKKFKEQQITPMPGLQVNMDGVVGTVKSVSGGRTIVDFNHPLSGKDVVYDVDIKKIVTDDTEKVKSLLSMLLNMKDAEITVKDKKVEIKAKQIPPLELGKSAADKIKDLTGLKQVDFVSGDAPAKKDAKPAEKPKK